MTVFLNNTKESYNEKRFSIREGSYLYDTYRYYKVQTEFLTHQLDTIDQIKNLIEEIAAMGDSGEQKKKALDYGKLHIAKCLWGLKLDEALLIEQRDKLTITRALY